LQPLTNHQVFALLTFLTLPYIFITGHIPPILARLVGNNGWLVTLSVLLPGILLVMVYYLLVKNSARPFPLMLEEHLGKPMGKALGLLYIIVFILMAVLTLRSFVSFVQSNVLPTIPISILISFVLLPALYSVKNGLNVSARVIELILPVFLILLAFVLITGMSQKPILSRLLPVGYFPSLKSLPQALLISFVPLGNIFFILTLAFFCQEAQLKKLLSYSLLLYIGITVAVNAFLITIQGASLTALLTCPMCTFTRSISVGGFIRNIEVVLVSIFLVGVFAAFTIQLFMICYTSQQVFSLKDYRFMASPVSLLLGFLSILIAPNIKVLTVIWEKMAPVFFCVFLILIPVILFLVIIIKNNPQAGPSPNPSQGQ
jgi:spore germination protein KB